MILSRKEKLKRSPLQRKDDRTHLIMCIPGIIKLILFAYIPMIGIYLAFVRYIPRSGLGSPFVGFDNFVYLFKSGNMVKIILTTVFCNLLFILVGTVFALFLALLMYEVKNKILLRLFQGIAFVPYFMSWVVVGLLFTGFFDSHGMISTFIARISGLEEFSFYTSSKGWLWILLFAHLWKSAGVSAIVYLSTMLSINKEIYEAADLDGANWWVKTFKVTIPHLTPMICVMTLIAIGGIVRSDFGLFFFVTRNAGPVMADFEVIDTFVYKLTIAGDSSDAISRSAAASLIQSVIGLVLVVASNSVVKKVNRESSLY